MSETCATVKVKTDAPDNEQGYILINESDFDPKLHEMFSPEGAKKPSDGLKVEDIKAALTAKGIAIPEGAKKPDLAALLDAAAADTP